MNAEREREKEVDGEQEQDVVRINSVTCLIFGWFALTFWVPFHQIDC